MSPSARFPLPSLACSPIATRWASPTATHYAPLVPRRSTPALGLSPEMRVSEFVATWFLPCYCGKRRRPLKPSTCAEFRTAVKRWIELIGDTRLRELTVDLCTAFVEAALALPSDRRAGETLSPHTVDKQAKALQTIFAMAGPRSQEHKDAAVEDGLLGTDRRQNPRAAPWFPSLLLPDRLPDEVFMLDEVSAWLDACQFARQPVLAECTPAAWWESLIRFGYATGLRIGTMLALRRADIHRDGRLAWLEIPGVIYKQSRPQVEYLSSHALAAVESIATWDVIWPWPHSRKQLYRVCDEIQARAGIRQGARFKFHALRRTNATEVYAHEPQAAQENLGHAAMSTTVGSYVAARGLVRAQARKRGPALEAIPQPRARRSRPAAGQLELF